jgi:hypothetical protein
MVSNDRSEAIFETLDDTKAGWHDSQDQRADPRDSALTSLHSGIVAEL